MSGTDAVSDTDMPPSVAPTATASDLRPRRGLFRKYIVALVVLVAATLCINAGVEFWFSFRESKAALLALQQEKADAAAQRIGEFVTGVERQIGWTTLPLWGAAPLDQRRFDFVRLLRQVPAITELTELDGDGKEQLKVSRLAMDVVGSAADYSHAPEFTEARANGVWFSPVSFRKESEPYMTLALADAGRNAGVTVASINLKLIWDVITALKIGEGGYAYVVDGRGKLIADPDISLVLRDTDFSKLPQVAAALVSASPDAEVAQTPTATAADDYYGRPVLSAHARIKPVGWRVFVEVPLKEAYAPLYALALRNVLWLVLALAGAALAAFLLARRMISPIHALQAGAAQIGAGALDRRIDIHTGDELEGLANQFNRMAADLETSYAELEHRVEERTAELSETLDQQTATAEVLGVINSSPGDLAPVFDAMLEKATRLCDAALGAMFRFDGTRMNLAAMRGLPLADASFFQSWTPGPGDAMRSIVEGAQLIHIPDIVDTDAYRSGVQSRVRMVEVTGARTALWVPLRKDEALLGVIIAYRREVRPFSDKQITLLRNFAAQAVIAMENTRLITETREALDQQTATAEVLGVINASPGQLTPVFEAILEKAHRFCGAERGTLFLFDGERFRAATTYGYPGALADKLREGIRPGVDTHAFAALMEGARLTHNHDLREIDDPLARAVSGPGGVRTNLLLPLRKEGVLLGMISCNRTEVRPFSEKEIALLENFAAQAVIAMENARLITETREALEQQTATAEVLGVINASPGDLAPVFEAMLEKAMRLCEADFGQLTVYDGARFETAATRGVPPAFAEYRRRNPPAYGPGTQPARLLAGERLILDADLKDSELYRSGDANRRALVDLGGARSSLMVALTRDDNLLGFIHIYRQEVRPFSDKQIALLQNFAAQAVIAIENARLITETQEALEKQTATAEILRVISSSTSDLQPVFEAIVERSARLCEADFSGVARFDDGLLRLVAVNNMRPGEAEAFHSLFPRPPTPDFVMGRAFLEGHTVHVHDILDYPGFNPQVRDVLQSATGYRTVVGVPIVRDGEPIGVIGCTRRDVRPFTPAQIELVETFADQALIAIENTRLITETREALDQQTATAEVLQVINANPGDLQPVFNVILEKAMALCDVAYGDLELYDGDTFRAVATLGLTDAFAEQVRRGYRAGDNPATRPLVAGERLSHIVNMAEADFSKVFSHAPAEDEGHQTLLCVPLRRENALLGMIACARREVRAFSEKEIALLESFAAQAVIAMENARLLTETREALDQQTATAEVLGVINASPGDLAPVFDVMVERAAHLCEADEAAVRVFDGASLHLAATYGTDPTALEQLRKLGATELRGLYAPFARGDDVAHYADARDTDAYRNFASGRNRIDARGIRSWLAVALRKEGTLLGIINVHRRCVRPFTDKQIALLQNFAAQAVIAIENARLLDEIRQRQAELRVTFDNMADGVVMFDQELRLAAWNRNFQELVELPDEFLAEPRTFAEYIRYLAERGEFGDVDPEAELARLEAQFGDQYSFNRTRPDGTVIEVRHNPMPEGGFVLIYSDITERTRSEEQIRQARDTAEAALTDLKAAQGRLIQAEKMASLGQLTAGIAHEIKNPLNFVNNFASLSVELLDELKEVAEPAIAALDEDKRDELDETIGMLTGNLEKIAEHGKRADNIVKSMLEHSRGVSGERREVDLNALVEEALNLAYHGARAQDQSFNIALERDLDHNLRPIGLVPQDMTRVFLNLFGNGFYAANKRAQANGDAGFRPILHVTTREGGDAVEVRVRDNGTGIPPDIRDKLFQPFFTTKPTGEGTGLGLSITYDIVTQQHGGTIAVDSEVGEFTEFTVRLPRQQQTRT